MKSIIKVLVLTLAVVVLLPAAPLCTSFSTLDQYLGGGFSCQVDNIVFSNFVYTGSMTGNPADTIGPPIPFGTVDASSVSVLADQGGKTGALQFRAVWEISGPDTDPTGGPPPGPNDGSTGPAYETLDISFTATPIAGHQVTNLFSQNQSSTGGTGTLSQDVTCSSPCVVVPPNYANSTAALVTPVSSGFTIDNSFQFVSNDDTADSHLSVINDAVLENANLLSTPEPGSILLGLGGLMVVWGCRRTRKA